MSVFKIKCPSCAAALKSTTPPPPGKVVTCPACNKPFPLPGKAPPANGARPVSTSQHRKETRLSSGQTKLVAGREKAPVKGPAPAAGPFRLACPACKAVLKSSVSIPAGKTVKCPACQKPFTVPASGAGPSGAAPKPAAPRPGGKTQLASRSPGPAAKTTLGGRPTQGAKTTLAQAKPSAGKTRLAAPAPAKTQLARPGQAQPPAARQTPLAGKSPSGDGAVFRLTCPACKVGLKSPTPIRAGKTVKCPACQKPFTVPAQSAPAPAAATRPGATPPAPATRSATPPAVASRSEDTTIKPKPPLPAKASASTGGEKPAATSPAAASAPQSAAGRRVLSIVLAIAGLGLLGGAAWVVVPHFWGGWVEFVPEDGGCRVLMPGKPEAQLASKYGPGLASVRKFTVIRPRDDQVFILSVSSRSATDLVNASFEELYDAQRDFILRSVNGKLVRERDISLDGHPGKEFQGQYSKGGSLVGRIYLVKGPPGDRVYILLVGGAGVKPDAGNAARFLDSFQLDSGESV